MIHPPSPSTRDQSATPDAGLDGRIERNATEAAAIERAAIAAAPLGLWSIAIIAAAR